MLSGNSVCPRSGFQGIASQLFITGDPGKDTPKTQKILRDKKNFPESVRSSAGAFGLMQPLMVKPGGKLPKSAR
jgi:hypothetical protein